MRWDYFDPMDALYALAISSTVMMLAADVERHRASHPQDVAGHPVPTSGAWLDEPQSVLHGLPPREAAQAEAPDQMLLESLLPSLP